MKERPEPLFLARETYRRRRIMDAARLLPFLGGFLFALPMLWAEDVGTVLGLVYIFAAWALLIGFAALIAAGLGRAPRGTGGGAGDGTGPEGPGA